MRMLFEGFTWRNKVVRVTFLLIVMFELLSFFGWAVPTLGNIVIVGMLAGLLAVSLYDLRIGVAAMAAELMIGSHGYLFAFVNDGLSVSLRIGMFLVVCSVALGKAVQSRSLRVWGAPVRTPLILMLAVLVYAALRGLQNGNGFSNVFFDANAFMFFGAALPFWQAVQNKTDLRFVLRAAFAGAMASVAKVLVLMYMFSHKLWWALPETYRWVRDTRIGELTQMTDTVFRIFLQSQIYTVIAFFLALAVFVGAYHKQSWHDLLRQDRARAYIFVMVFLMASILISLSRSNWIGMVAAMVSLPVFLSIMRWPLFRPTILAAGTSLATAVLALVLMAGIILVPFPPANGSFSASLFGSRALTFKEEAGIGSRWALLPPLWSAIARDPLFGQGFGTEVTYKTQDPRLLAQNPTGEYTTFIFEWGYHDLWLKLGIFGLLAYAYLLVVIVKPAWSLMRSETEDPAVKAFVFGLTLGLVSLLVTHTTSPYVNHPLGISYLLFYGLCVHVLTLDKQSKNASTDASFPLTL